MADNFNVLTALFTPVGFVIFVWRVALNWRDTFLLGEETVRIMNVLSLKIDSMSVEVPGNKRNLLKMLFGDRSEDLKYKSKNIKE